MHILHIESRIHRYHTRTAWLIELLLGAKTIQFFLLQSYLLRWFEPVVHFIFHLTCQAHLNQNWCGNSRHFEINVYFISTYLPSIQLKCGNNYMGIIKADFGRKCNMNVAINFLKFQRTKHFSMLFDATK